MRIWVEREWIPIVDAIAAGDEFPDWHDPRWHTFQGSREHGKQEGQASIAGPRVGALHDRLADLTFVKHLADVFGLPALAADPDRVGGGIHQIAPAGRLAKHHDFNVHPKHPDLVRAVNVILFVSEPGIGPYDPGALVLGEGPHEIRIAPEPGTLVAFSAEDGTWHGHPDPIAESSPRRRSIPAYYYRPIRPDETIVARSTAWLA